jgi:hypothetical protein
MGGRTAVANEWLAARLAMGHASYVSALVNQTLRDAKARRMVERLEREFAGREAAGGSGGGSVRSTARRESRAREHPS